MIPKDIKNIIMEFTPSVSNRTLCVGSIKCVERAPIVSNTGYAWMQPWCVLDTSQLFSRILKLQNKYGCPLADCPEMLYRKIQLIWSIYYHFHPDEFGYYEW